MKTSHIIPAAITAFALISTVNAAKDETHKGSKKSLDDNATSMQSGMDSMQIRRVTQDSLDRKSTAKDLIGASLYDNNNEKIGTIADLSIDGLSFGRQMENSQHKPSDNKDAYNSKGEHDSTQASANWSQGNNRNKSGMHGQVTAFISVGGLFGIGDDIVAVPAEQITWDSRKEHYTLSADKSQIVALAEQEPIDMDDDSYYSAKQSFDDDSALIRNAFQSDESKKDFAGVMVTKEDDRIILRGTVRNEKTKERAAEIARDKSDLRIENLVEVRSY